MAFIDHQHGVFRQIFEQGRRRFARGTPGQIAGIVLNPGAMARGLHHLEIKHRALFDTLGFEQLVFLLQLGEPFLELGLDAFGRLLQGRFGCDVMAVGIDGDLIELAGFFTGQRVKLMN